MGDLVSIIKDVGFPIAVTIYLLVRYDMQLTEMRKSLTKICVSIEGLKKVVEKND